MVSALKRRKSSGSRQGRRLPRPMKSFSAAATINSMRIYTPAARKTLARRQWSAAAKPSGETQPAPARGHHGVLSPLGQKRHQPPAYRFDIGVPPVVGKDSEHAAVGGFPMLVEIKRHRHLPLVAPARLIDMAGIAGSRRVPRVMPLR